MPNRQSKQSGADESMVEQISIEDEALEEILSKTNSRSKDSEPRRSVSPTAVSRNLKHRAKLLVDTKVSRSFDSSDPINIDKQIENLKSGISPKQKQEFKFSPKKISPKKISPEKITPKTTGSHEFKN